MKICTICKKEKSENDFFYRNKTTEKLHSQCKGCYVEKRRKIWKQHYYKYGSQYRERAVLRKRKLKDNLRKQLHNYLLGKSCIKCGFSDPRALEFDHIDPISKSFGIARAITNTVSWVNILTEIGKCQILCANCHKIKISTEQNWYKGRIL